MRLLDIPPWRAREPEREQAAQAMLVRLWATERYREAVAEAFSRSASPEPYLMLSKVDGAPVWISYVIDPGQHKLRIASIDSEGSSNGTSTQENEPG